MEYMSLEFLRTNYDVLKALRHLIHSACLAFSSAPAILSRSEWYYVRVRTDIAQPAE